MSEHLGESVLAFVTDQMEPGARAAAALHLECCASCLDEVRRVQSAVRALGSWPRQPQLPAAAEQAVLASFGRWTRPSAAGPVRVPRLAALRAAATLILVLAGGAAGYALGFSRSRRAEPVAQAPGPLFLLLLEEQVWPDATRPRTGYIEWARTLREADRLDSAEKLTDEPGWRVDSEGRVTRPESGVRPPNVSGWFLVRAESYEAAIDLAKRGPHLRFGSVLVRQVE
jgi:hypothetical protein